MSEFPKPKTVLQLKPSRIVSVQTSGSSVVAFTLEDFTYSGKLVTAQRLQAAAIPFTPGYASWLAGRGLGSYYGDDEVDSVDFLISRPRRWPEVGFQVTAPPRAVWQVGEIDFVLEDEIAQLRANMRADLEAANIWFTHFGVAPSFAPGAYGLPATSTVEVSGEPMPVVDSSKWRGREFLMIASVGHVGLGEGGGLGGFSLIEHFDNPGDPTQITSVELDLAIETAQIEAAKTALAATFQGGVFSRSGYRLLLHRQPEKIPVYPTPEFNPGPGVEAQAQALQASARADLTAAAQELADAAGGQMVTIDGDNLVVGPPIATQVEQWVRDFYSL